MPLIRTGDGNWVRTCAFSFFSVYVVRTFAIFFSQSILPTTFFPIRDHRLWTAIEWWLVADCVIGYEISAAGGAIKAITIQRTPKLSGLDMAATCQHRDGYMYTYIYIRSISHYRALYPYNLHVWLRTNLAAQWAAKLSATKVVLVYGVKTELTTSTLQQREIEVRIGHFRASCLCRLHTKTRRTTEAGKQSRQCIEMKEVSRIWNLCSLVNYIWVHLVLNDTPRDRIVLRRNGRNRSSSASEFDIMLCCWWRSRS